MLEIMRKHASGWMIKVLFGVIIVVFIFFFGTSSFRGKGDPVIAYVNDQPILARDFMRAYEETMENTRRNNPDAAPEALQNPQIKQGLLAQMVNTQLVRSAAERLHIGVSSMELRTAISRMQAFQDSTGAFDPERYTQVLAQNRMTPAGFEQSLRDNLLMEKMRAYVSQPVRADEAQARSLFTWAREQVRIDYLLFTPAEFLPKAEVSDAKVQEFYDQNKDKFVRPATAEFRYLAFTPKALAPFQDIKEEDVKAYYEAHKTNFTQPEEVRARHILIPVAKGAPEAEAKKAEATIRELAAKIKAGADFAEMARKHSQDASAANGGDLGWFGRGVMVKPFEDAAFALKKGEVSQPVRSEFGWHLIQLEDRHEPRTPSYEEAKGQVRQQLAEERASEKISDLLDSALDQLAAGVKIDKISQEVGVPLKTTDQVTLDGLTQLFGMTPEAAKTLFALPLGMGVKTPLAIEGGYLLADKVQDQPEAVLPLSDVKGKILTFLKNQEAMRLAGDKASQALEALRAGKDDGGYLKDVHTSAPFNRTGMIPAIGGSPQLAQAVFAAANNDWLPQTFRLPAGVVVVRLKERIAPPEETWRNERAFWLSTVSQRYGDELFQAYLTELRSKAKVEVVRPDLLN